MSKPGPKPSVSEPSAPSLEGGARGLGTVPQGAVECVWMRAGVVTYRLCDRDDQNCDTCALYSALRGGPPRPVAKSTAAGTVSLSKGAGCEFPGDRRYYGAHSWLQIPGPNLACVGLDALGTWLLKSVRAIDFPGPDTWLDRGDVMATADCGAAKIKLRSPVSGRVLGRNPLLVNTPELLLEDPYGAGWLIDLVTVPERGGAQLEALLTGPEMAQLAGSDLERLRRRAADMAGVRPVEVGATAADGGEPVTDLRVMLGAARYLELVQEMLA